MSYGQERGMRTLFSLVVGVALLAGSASAATPETARIGAVQGNVVLQSGAAASAVGTKTHLKTGDVLKVGTDARVTLAFADGGSVLVAGPAVLDVAQLNTDGRRLLLRNGAIPRAQAGTVALELQTPAGASLVLQNAIGSAAFTNGATSFAKLGGAHAQVWNDGSAQTLSGSWSSVAGVVAPAAAAMDNHMASAGGKSYGAGDTLRVGAGSNQSVSFGDGTTMNVVGPAELGFVQMDSSGHRVMLRSGTATASVSAVALEIQTPADASLVLQNATGMARVSGGNVSFQKTGGDYAQVWNGSAFRPLSGSWSNSAGAAPVRTAPVRSAPSRAAAPAVTRSTGGGGSREARIRELEAEVSRLRGELDNARAAGYSGKPGKSMVIGDKVITYRPSDDFKVEKMSDGGAKLTYDGADFGVVTVGQETNMFLWLDESVTFDGNGDVVAFTGVSHLYDPLSTFFMWDNPIENGSDASPSRPGIR